MSKTLPPISDLALELERLATELRRDGMAALQMARLMEDRGWPATSGAAGSGSRGSSDSTSVEAAHERPTRLPAVRDDLYAGIRTTYNAACGLRDTLGKVMSHGDTDSTERHNRQPGSGPCMACTRDVPGTQNDRLRAGFCDRCRKRWSREGRPDRAAFIRATQAAMVAPVEHVDPTDPHVLVGDKGT